MLRGAAVVELEPASVEVADLRVEQGRITDRGPNLPVSDGDEVLEVAGKVVMPGLVSCHHHLFALYLRGAPRARGGYPDALAAQLRLEDALDLDAVEAAAVAGAVEGLLSGTTTVFDVHASPAAVKGSLARVARGLGVAGLRGLVGYQVTDRHGALGREDALQECVDFAARAKGRVRGALAAASPAELSPDALTELAQARAACGGWLHLLLGEDARDEAGSQDRHQATPLQRLLDARLVDEQTLLAQNVHVAWPELAQVLSTGAWLLHSARSNMETMTGVANVAKFGVRGCLGTDVMPLDMLTEAQVAWLRARDAGQPIDVLRLLANGHRLASKVFGVELGPLRPGCGADLVVLDYRAPTPLDSRTLADHLLHGFSPRNVESVMVDGVWRVLRREPLVDTREVADAASAAAQGVWTRMGPGVI